MPSLLGTMKPSTLKLMESKFILKLLNGLTPMLETNVDTVGLITSMMSMLLSLTLPLMLAFICTLPSIKDLVMNLGVSLISPLTTSMKINTVPTTQLVITNVTMLMNGIMLKDLINVLMIVVVTETEPVLMDGALVMPDLKTTIVMFQNL